MKNLLMLLLSLFFALWTLAMIPGCVNSLLAAGNVTRFTWELVCSLIPMYIIGMFAYWSFQSAVTRPTEKKKKTTKKIPLANS